MGPVIESQRKGPKTEEQAQLRTHQTDIGLWQCTKNSVNITKIIGTVDQSVQGEQTKC